MEPEGSNNKPVVGGEELCAPVDPAVLKDPPASANENVINLLSNTPPVLMYLIRR